MTKFMDAAYKEENIKKNVKKELAQKIELCFFMTKKYNFST